MAVDPQKRALASHELTGTLREALVRLMPKGTLIAAFRAREEKGEAGLDELLRQPSAFRWCFPRSLKTHELSFHEAEVPLQDRAFEKSEWGIWEPVGDAPVSPETILLVLVPLLAFDRSGNRLGQGKGYYDRFLPQTNAVRIGIAYSWQQHDKLIKESHDQPLHFVCTEKELIPFQH